MKISNQMSRKTKQEKIHAILHDLIENYSSVVVTTRQKRKNKIVPEGTEVTTRRPATVQ